MGPWRGWMGCAVGLCHGAVLAGLWHHAVLCHGAVLLTLCRGSVPESHWAVPVELCHGVVPLSHAVGLNLWSCATGW